MSGFVLLSKDFNLSPAEFRIAGFVLILVGILTVGVGRSLVGTFSMIFLGIYSFLRASGQIGHQYFRYGVGVALCLLGVVLTIRIIDNMQNNKRIER